MANWMENTTQMRFSYRLLPIKWLTWVHSYFFTIKIFWSKYLAWKFMLNLPIYLCSLGAMLFVLNSCMGFSDLSSVQRGRDWLSVYFAIRWYVWTNLCSVSLCIFTISFICIQCKVFPTNEKKKKDLHSVMSRYFDMIPLSCTSKNPPPSDPRFGWRSVITMASVFNLSH